MDKLNMTLQTPPPTPPLEGRGERMGYPLQNALKALVLLTVLSICPQGMARNLVDYRVVPLPMSIQTDTTKTFTLQSAWALPSTTVSQNSEGMQNSYANGWSSKLASGCN